ncbi:hypothetical protein [Acaryochloris marina]|uniref:hypothetical protein n=1 Tax=Acaryochloris marina TaxID=155978 RepID=UPI001BB09C0B|nr:hypothetical protein [Acaryochloris marina]QUY44810.1 hypothetical protein I1H34_12415 [Acaryochloris marina S15]
MEAEEIIIRYYGKPIPVMVDPGKNHPRHERDLLLGWIDKEGHKSPVLKSFPNAKIMAKIE